MNTLSINLKRLLKEKHITQRDLANKVGVTEQTISRYISGDRLPNYNIIENIVSALNINVTELFNKNSTKEEVLDCSGLTTVQIQFIKALIVYFRYFEK